MLSWLLWEHIGEAQGNKNNFTFKVSLGEGGREEQRVGVKLPAVTYLLCFSRDRNPSLFRYLNPCSFLSPEIKYSISKVKRLKLLVILIQSFQQNNFKVCICTFYHCSKSWRSTPNKRKIVLKDPKINLKRITFAETHLDRILFCHILPEISEVDDSLFIRIKAHLF